MTMFTATGDWSGLVPGARVDGYVRFQQIGANDAVGPDVRAQIVNGVLRAMDGSVGVQLTMEEAAPRFFRARVPNLFVDGMRVPPVRFLFQAPTSGGQVDLAALYPALAVAVPAGGGGGGNGDYATQADIDQAVSGLASTGYVDDAVSGLATTGDVSSAVAGLASTGYVDSAVSSRATPQDVSDAVAGLASTQDLNTAVAGLASTSYVDAAVAAYAAKTVAGPVSDDDFDSPPADGTVAVDTEAPALYVRVSGTWMSAALE